MRCFGFKKIEILDGAEREKLIMEFCKIVAEILRKNSSQQPCFPKPFPAGGYLASNYKNTRRLNRSI